MLVVSAHKSVVSSSSFPRCQLEPIATGEEAFPNQKKKTKIRKREEEEKSNQGLVCMSMRLCIYPFLFLNEGICFPIDKRWKIYIYGAAGAGFRGKRKRRKKKNKTKPKKFEEKKSAEFVRFPFEKMNRGMQQQQHNGVLFSFKRRAGFVFLLVTPR